MGAMTYQQWLEEVGKFMVEPGLINRTHVAWPRRYNQGMSPEDAYTAALKGDFLIWGQQ